MTIKELRVEAEALGYILVPKTNYVRILNCPICGKKNTRVWYNGHGQCFRKCNVCGFVGDLANNTYRTTNESWNAAVTRYIEENNKSDDLYGDPEADLDKELESQGSDPYAPTCPECHSPHIVYNVSLENYGCIDCGNNFN